MACTPVVSLSVTIATTLKTLPADAPAAILREDVRTVFSSQRQRVKKLSKGPLGLADSVK